MKRFVFLVLAMLVPSLHGVAQNDFEFSRFQEEAGKLSTLYRGKAPSYVHMLYNGTYFWSSPEFRSGSVQYNGKVYRDVLLNIDAFTQNLQVRSAEGMPPVELVRDFVEWFTIGDERYVNGDTVSDELPDGYFQLLSESPALVLFRVDKPLRSDVNNVNGSAIGYEDPNYRSKVLNYFSYQPSYYMQKKGKWKKVSRKKALKTINGTL